MPSSSSSASRWLVFVVVLAADMLDLLDSTVTNIAAPTIVRELQAGPGLIPWLGLSYALPLGSLLVIGGRIGDRFGARRIFLIGSLGFVIANLVVSLADDPVTVVGFRVVQGCFGALLMPQGFTLVLRVFAREDLGRVFGLFGPLLALSSISGPPLAGLLIHIAPPSVGWRAVFASAAALATVVALVGWRVLPRLDGSPDARVAALPSILVMGGLLAVLGGIVSGLPAWVALPLITLGVAALGVFVITQRRSADPLLSPTLFRKRSFVAGVLVGSLFFAAVSGTVYTVSLYLQTGLGLGVFPTAALMAPLSAGIIVTSFAFRSRVASRGRRLVGSGIALTTIGAVVFGVTIASGLAPDAPWVVTIPLSVLGLGMGCCFGSFFSTALGDVTDDEAGSASGALNALQQVANAVGSGVVSATFLATGGSAIVALSPVLGNPAPLWSDGPASTADRRR